MNNIIKDTRTPIEIALDIDSNGMTTARKLYDFLELASSQFARWCKTNIIDNEFAEENIDYWTLDIDVENPLGGRPSQDFRLTAHFAKKLCMKGNGERAEQAREYFSHIEEKVKETAINRASLSPQMQMLMGMVEAQARQELEQKRQADQLNRIESNQKAITDTFQKSDDEDDFKSWCKRCISKIIHIGKFTNGSNTAELFRNAWSESFDRLNQKRPCNLKQRVINAKGIALESGRTKTWIEQNINNLSVIASDKDLRPAYESVMREMMIYYCVDVA